MQFGIRHIRPKAAICLSLSCFGLLLVGSQFSVAQDNNTVSADVSERSSIEIKKPRFAKQNWILNCMGCHKVDASGIPVEMPSLNGHVAKFLSVEGGREYLGYVPGVATAPIADENLADLLNWMLVTFDPENIPDDFEPYTGDEVGRLRQLMLKSDINDVRSALIEKISETSK